MVSGTISADPSDQLLSITGLKDTITLSSVTAPTYTIDSIDLSAIGCSNITMGGPYTAAGASGAGSISVTSLGAGFTAGTGWNNTGASGTNVPWMTQSLFSAPKIQLNGEGADVEVNGWSLVAAVKRIEERLAIMQPNPELESEWSELKQLGEQYRKLEQHILDKQGTWDRLKAMPPPEID